MKSLFFLALVLLTLGSFGQMLPIKDSELIKTSEDIVRGTVLSTKAQWVNNGKLIYTFTKLRVDENISGTRKKGDVITIVTPGGYDPVKDLGMRVSHQAVFEEGEDVEVFLVKAQGEMDAIDYRFLKNDSKLPKDILRVNGYFQGKRKIYTDAATKKLMILKPNEDRVEEFSKHQLEFKQELKSLRRNN